MAQSYTLNKIYELAGDDKEFIADLVNAFLEEIPKDLGYLESAVKSEKPKIAYEYAHKMKPSFQMFSVNVMNELKVFEFWSEGHATDEEVKLALFTLLERANKALSQIRNDFKK